ncbi:hypothetical protein L9F63_022139 [Diploptera punctata]|uniref:Uncharacterized protein n=1 Tax=Diploptera punctata TaxID=6984 RepID=A0AAD7ZN98_DIPPU|nr:hypothetical protein L9F63_022139 [Diploptera punctata]
MCELIGLTTTVVKNGTVTPIFEEDEDEAETSVQDLNIGGLREKFEDTAIKYRIENERRLLPHASVVEIDEIEKLASGLLDIPNARDIEAMRITELLHMCFFPGMRDDHLRIEAEDQEAHERAQIEAGEGTDPEERRHFTALRVVQYVINKLCQLVELLTF